ncbi:fimbrial protein [Rosenbergiella australiborealis]|uniref:fimbrial protein n=1 Tax=Rosenbergiella australiborealis TaxID=1544696 RepID=UPI001F4DBD7A|nr:fimbrial protein [Rosenbergiella australiborealis]
MNGRIKIFLLPLLFLWTPFSFAFTCVTTSGQTLSWSGGTASVYITLPSSIYSNTILSIDLSQYVTCKNDSGDSNWTDQLRLVQGTTFNGALNGFTGTINFNGNSYPIPFSSTSSNKIDLPSLKNIAIPIQLSLTPIQSSSTNTVITYRSKIASIVMNQQNNRNSDSVNFTWNIYSLSPINFIVPSCSVDNTTISAQLPNYPGTQSIPLKVTCSSNQRLGFYIYGTTGTDGSTFVNTLESNNDSGAAHGVGVQLLRNGSVLPVNTQQTIGTVGTSGTDLGLSARYNQLGTTRITAGNVRSIVNLNFVYL